MSAEEKKYVYPEVEQDYEELDYFDNETDNSYENVYDVPEQDYSAEEVIRDDHDENFRLSDMKDVEIDIDEYDRAARRRDSAYQYCTVCGKKFPSVRRICPRCGTGVSRRSYRRGKEVSKWVSFLLCLFLGVLGAHKFYEGKIGMGILYIFTGGLLGIGVLVDLIAILFKDDPYYVEK
ncbi:MAG: NINE protein [Erysipelotrichaceae bacterium]|nr:NINE protein [Erysipelotrichaceae bacterium]